MVITRRIGGVTRLIRIKDNVADVTGDGGGCFPAMTCIARKFNK